MSNTQHRNSVMDKIKNAQIPTLPDVLHDIAKKMQDPETSVLDIAKLIKQDPALTARVLKLVNSSFYGLSQKITQIERAVAILGMTKIRTLIFTTQVIDFLKYDGDDAFNFRIFWEHSLTTALAAEVICAETDRVRTDEAFVAGLLHDIGKLMMAIYLPDLFQGWKDSLAADEDSFPFEIETGLFGVDHGRIGAWFVKQWSLPSAVVLAIAHHHSPSTCQNESGAENARELANVLHVADILARSVGIGCSSWDKVPPRDREAWRELGITPDSYDQVLQRLRIRIHSARDFYNLIREQMGTAQVA